MDTQSILFILIFVFCIIFAVFLRKKKDRIKEYFRLSEAVWLIAFCSIGLIICLAVWFLAVKTIMTGEPLIEGNTKSLIIFYFLTFVMTILMVFGLISGYKRIRSSNPKIKIIGVPVNQEFPLNVSRVKFLLTALFSPNISFRSIFILFSLTILAIIAVFDFNSLSTKSSITILIFAFIYIADKIITLYNYNKLYSCEKNDVLTYVTPYEIGTKTLKNIVIFNTPWNKVDYINVCKDYIVCVSNDRDYFIFTQDEITKNNVKLCYYRSRKCLQKPEEPAPASFYYMLEHIKNMAKPAIVYNESKKPLGNPCLSKIGGRPYITKDFIFPQIINEDKETVPMHFLAQLNLAEISKYDKNNILPSKGMLYFFASNYDETSKVVYYEDCSGFELCNADKMSVISDETAFDIKTEYSIPYHYDFIPLQNDEYTYDVQSYYKAYDNVFEELNKHSAEGYELGRTLGYGMYFEASALENAVYADLNITDLEMLPQDEIKTNMLEWVLLFQINLSSLPYPKETDGIECDAIYFYIKKDDLLKKNFDNVYCEFQYE